MALKLPDSAVPMGDFPVAKAVDIDFDDGENLQDKFDNGALGGGGDTTVISDLENRVTINETNITGLQEQIDNLDIPEDVDLTDINDRLTGLENNQIKKINISHMSTTEPFYKITLSSADTFSKILMTELYGGCILITGSIIPEYKSIKVVRLSNGCWSDHSSSNNANNKIQNVYYDGSFIYIKLGNYVKFYIEGGFTNVEKIDSVPTEAIELPIVDLTQKLDVDITTTINSFSTDTQIPTAKTVALLHNGSLLNTSVDVLQLNVGVYNITSDHVAKSCTNLPSEIAGVLIIRNIMGDTGDTPYNSPYKYQVYEYSDIGGNRYICSTRNDTSTVSPDNVTVHGWYKVATSKDLTTVNTKITALEENANDLFQSVSDGKTLVANAITDKGVSTSSTDTFATMATNISKINTATVGYTSEQKSGSKTTDRGDTASISMAFSNTVLGVTEVDYSWSSAHLSYRGFSISGNTVTVKIALSSSYSYATSTVSCTVTANILA